MDSNSTIRRAQKKWMEYTEINKGNLEKMEDQPRQQMMNQRWTPLQCDTIRINRMLLYLQRRSERDLR